MQFIPHGPQIPERLLRAHEAGRVVFFCGAGISYPAGLPGFAGLVEQLYAAYSINRTPEQQTAIKAGQFDTAIGLLEAYVQPGREDVRSKLAEILTPDLDATNATTTHEALLELAKNKDDQVRLITTNFDRLFEHAKTKKSWDLPEDFKAPHLPVPKVNWSGLVYLHGQLPPDDSALNDLQRKSKLDQLVVSSGDFGLAYLSEGWAARFVRELFRRFTVCFVGYSISDPVLRYMLDALAAERLMGETPLEMFVFGDCDPGQEDTSANEWRAKNVTPILYHRNDGHTLLHHTLHAWADTWHARVDGKVAIVAQYAHRSPKENSAQDDFVGRVLWALSDPSGLPARKFAELDPVPSLDWLRPLSEPLYRRADLEILGVASPSDIDNRFPYSLLERPAPYSPAPQMGIAGWFHPTAWDPVMKGLARWLLSHLNNPELLFWVIKHYRQLHDEMTLLIEDRLTRLHALSRDDNAAALNNIYECTPDAIPSPAMHALWGLLISGSAGFHANRSAFYYWVKRFKRDGLTASLRLSLKDAIRPHFILSKKGDSLDICPINTTPISEFSDYMNQLYTTEIEIDRLSRRRSLYFFDKKNKTWHQSHINDVVDWGLIITSDYRQSHLRELSENKRWADSLPILLDDFINLLRDALDLMCELGGASKEHDLSYIDQISISDDWHEGLDNCWTALIKLTRDAWAATAEKSPERARVVAETWALGPYPVFQRLAFFAAAQTDIIPPRQAIGWLLTDGKRWLWALETQLETIPLLASLAPKLDKNTQAELEQAILCGPSREWYPDFLLSDWEDFVARMVWWRLAVLLQAGATLSAAGQSRFNAISEQCSLSFAEAKREKFHPWAEKTTKIPRTRRGVLNYLLRQSELKPWQKNDWHELCAKRFQTTAYALCTLAKKEIWPVEHWRVALRTWKEERQCERAWHYMAPLITAAPDSWIKPLSNEISRWLLIVSQTTKEHKDRFLRIAKHILHINMDHCDDYFMGNNNKSYANHLFDRLPTKTIIHALVSWHIFDNQKKRPGLPRNIKNIFTRFCNEKTIKFQHIRAALATCAPTLLETDPAWAKKYIIPLFEWNHSNIDAIFMWMGLLHSAMHLYNPYNIPLQGNEAAKWKILFQSPSPFHRLMKELKPAMLDTVKHYAQLENYGEKFAAFLTAAALDSGNIFTTEELAAAMRALPREGLPASTRALYIALEITKKGKRENYWRNRILPFWKKTWPHSKEMSPSVDAKALALVCILTGSEFPSAMATLRNWLDQVQNPEHIIQRLQEAGLPTRFPEESLQLLEIILPDNLRWLNLPELRPCLDAIGQAAPALRATSKFKNIDELERRITS